MVKRIRLCIGAADITCNSKHGINILVQLFQCSGKQELIQERKNASLLLNKINGVAERASTLFVLIRRAGNTPGCCPVSWVKRVEII